MNKELILHGKFFGNGDGLDHLQQMLSTFTERNDNEYSSALKQYKNYKENFLKHLDFDPTQPNLSELILTKAIY